MLGEPLLDTLLEERIFLLRQCCPLATIRIFSNGDMLDHAFLRAGYMGHAAVALLRLYSAGLNVIGLDAYDDAEQFARYWCLVQELEIRGVKRVDSLYGTKGYSKRAVYLENRSSSAVPAWGFHNWQAPELVGVVPVTKPRTQVCPRPHRQINVRVNGDIPLCCAIAPHIPQELVGNVQRTTLLEAWNSDMMHEYRLRLQSGAREKICAGCVSDVIGFPHCIRKVK